MKKIAIILFQGADEVGQLEGNRWRVAIARHVRTLRGRIPWHVRKHTVREPEDPMPAPGEGLGAVLGSLRT
jgi:hypothetical protein